MKVELGSNQPIACACVPAMKQFILKAQARRAGRAFLPALFVLLLL